MLVEKLDENNELSKSAQTVMMRSKSFGRSNLRTKCEPKINENQVAEKRSSRGASWIGRIAEADEKMSVFGGFEHGGCRIGAFRNTTAKFLVAGGYKADETQEEIQDEQDTTEDEANRSKHQERVVISNCA